MDKQDVRFWFSVVLIVVSIISMIGMGINQWSGFIKDTRTAMARSGCLPYMADGAIIDGEIYCSRVSNGKTVIASLEWLKENIPLE